MRRRLVLFSFVFLALILGIDRMSAAAGTKLVAATYSDRYHLPGCKIAQKIAPEDLRTFNSPEEAVAAGLVPCKKCNPPVPKDCEREETNFGGRQSGDPNS